MHEVPFIGHVATSEGLRVDPHKVKAIQEMPPPPDVAAVQRLLGLAQYLSKFPTSPLGHHQAIERADTARYGVGVGASTTGSTRVTQVGCIKHAHSSLLQCGRGGNTAV